MTPTHAGTVFTGMGKGMRKYTRGLPVSYLSPGGPEEACWLPDPRPRVARDQQLILGRKEGDFNTRFFRRFNSVRACGLGSVLYNGV